MSIQSKLYGKTVFVTGADGFVGSHLSEYLVNAGADVHLFIRSTSSGEVNNIDEIIGKVKIYRGDIADPHSVKLAIRKLKSKALTKPYIFHFAAQAHVGESWERPYETFQVNATGTLNMLQAIIDENLKIECFDFAGTSEEYGNVAPDQKHLHKIRDGTVIFNEASPVSSQSPYATSKIAGDFLCQNYYSAYGLPIIISRMFNNYGPKQNPRYVTPTIITQALSKNTIELGHLKPTRDFTYVTDGVRGHIYAALLGKPGSVYSYGMGKDISIGEWYNMILEIGAKEGFWPKDTQVKVSEERFRPGQSDILKLGVDFSKIRDETGWEPIVPREEGIRDTIKWYANNKNKWITRVDW